MSSRQGFQLPDELALALDDDCRTAIKYAQHEASRMHHAVCTTAHLLLGLIRIGKATGIEKYQTRRRWGSSNVEARQLVQDTFANVNPTLVHIELWTKTCLDVMRRARDVHEQGRITADNLYESLRQLDESYASLILDRLDEVRY